jgi:cytochrome c oxidase assembly factor CtaG
VLFSLHMVAHMTLSMVAPIGLVLGGPITLALRALPGRRTPKELGLRQLLQMALHSRVVRVLSHPLVAAGLFVGSLYALYFTSLFSRLMDNHLGHVLMEFHFITVGCLFFWVLIGVDPTPRRLHPLARTGLLLLVMPFHAFFAIAIMNTDTVLARSYFETLHRPYSSNLLADQSLGGGISWALGEVPIVLVMAAIFTQWVRSDFRDARRADREAARADQRAAQQRAEQAVRGDAPGADVDAPQDDLARYNAYLARLSGGRTAGQHEPPPDGPPPSAPRRDR